MNRQGLLAFVQAVHCRLIHLQGCRVKQNIHNHSLGATHLNSVCPVVLRELVFTVERVYSVGMRVDNKDIDIIVETIKEKVADAAVYLFGSRADDAKRGGDIDLFLNTSRAVSLSEKISLLTQLERKGINRKVDLIIQTPEHKQDIIYQEVQQKGIRLC